MFNILIFDYFNSFLESRDQWASGHRQLTYNGHFLFTGLEADTEYEIIIQSRNTEGWSDPAEIFKFTTRSKGQF